MSIVKIVKEINGQIYLSFLKQSFKIEYQKTKNFTKNSIKWLDFQDNIK